MIKRILSKDKKIIIIFALLLISCMSFWYRDSQAVVRHSMNIWKALFEGRFFEFYSYNFVTLSSGETMPGAGYEVFLYLIFAIWNLPLYIFEQFLNGRDILDFFAARVYAKLFLVILVYGVGKLTESIALCCGLDKKKAEQCFYLFVISPAVFSSVTVCGQIDIIGLVFILLGFRAYLENKSLQFYIWFICAIQCKTFALFVFIPLVLLKEKNIIKILLKIALPILIMQVINIPFLLNDPMGVASKSIFSEVVINELLAMKLNFMGQGLPYIFLMFGAVCMLAYLSKPKDEKNNLFYVYFAFLGWIAVLLLFASPYRLIYLIPFIVILFMSKEENFYLRYILFSMVMVIVILGYLKEFNWCYDFSSMYNMLWDILIPFRKFELIGIKQLPILGEDHYGLWTIFYSIFVVYGLCFAYVHFPGKRENGLNTYVFDKVEKIDKNKERMMFYFFTFINYLVTNIAVILLLISVLCNIINKIR